MGESDGKLWALGTELLRMLGDAGYEAYMVGGSVRDRLIGRAIHDIDIATSAMPEQVQALFPRTLPTGLAHGTVTVMVDGIPFEVTTYRTETGYSDARRPDEVAFVQDVREDLARRDFTFNAMAVGLDGELLDPFGGQADLAAGIVRTVGRAVDRFGEDALRMLRAIRFGAEFGFELAADAWDGITARRERLTLVAMERIGAEWDKMMAGSGPDRACSWLHRSGLLSYVREPLPVATAGDFAKDGAWASVAGAEGLRLAELAEADVRWAAYWIGVGATEAEALKACKTLRLSGKRGARIAGIVGFERRLAGEGKLALLDGCDRVTWIEAVLDYGILVAQDWLAIREAARAGSGGERGSLSLVGDALDEREWLAAMPIARVGELAVRGDELSKRLGRPPGPWVASLLRRLLSEVAHGRLVNDTVSLMGAAERLSATDGL